MISELIPQGTLCETRHFMDAVNVRHCISHDWFTTPLTRHLESADTTPIQTQRTWAVPALLTLLVGKPAVASTRGLSPVLGQAWLPGEPRSG